MIWLTWRQMRAQTLAAAGALALLAVYLVHLHSDIGAFHDTRIAGCTGQACTTARLDMRSTYLDTVSILALTVIAVPALIGIFWGAPLVTRELQERTDRLVWNQSVTRTRWLAVKLAVTGAAAAAVAGGCGLLLAWSAGPYDAVVGERFAAMHFSSRDVVPFGYGLLAFVLGTVTGMIVRRTLPAMAVTLVVFAALQLTVPAVVRRHLLPPVTETIAADAAVLSSGVGLSLEPDDTLTIRGYTVAGGWPLQDASPLRKPDGSPYTAADERPCLTQADWQASVACTAGQRLTFRHTYHPGSRYWTFQWMELGLYTVGALLLAGLGFLRLRRLAR